MATTLPDYPDRNPFIHAPSYSVEPRSLERRLAQADRLRARPTSDFVKESKGGGVRLRLSAQEENVVPVYGAGDHVSGTIELSKIEHVTCVEVRVDGKLHLREVAEGGTANAILASETATLWFKDRVNQTCPSSLPFSIPLPATFQHDKQTYRLPPTFDVKLSGLPGFVASVDYSVSAIVTKPHGVPVPKVKSKALGLHIGTSIVSTPFVYLPRSKPSEPIPLPLRHLSYGFELTPDWKLFQYVLPSASSNGQHLDVSLYIPSSRIFSMTASVPFHLTLEGSATALAAFLPLSPISENPLSRRVTRVQIMRQAIVDVRNDVVNGVKTDMWKVDCIGEGVFKHAGDGPTHISFTGEIPLDPNTIKVSPFKAAGLQVKDSLLFTVTPLESQKHIFLPAREVIAIGLVTDPWTPNGSGIGAEPVYIPNWDPPPA